MYGEIVDIWEMYGKSMKIIGHIWEMYGEIYEKYMGNMGNIWNISGKSMKI